MELKMSAETASPMDLPANDNTLFTGHMGDCVSTIVLFNFNGNTYQDIRGFHALGGIENTNWAALFGGPPNNATTKIYVVSGTLNGSVYRRGENESTAREKANEHGLGNAEITFFHAVSSASIDRSGRVT